MSECLLVLDNIRSVANVGSIFRTADCLGVSKIILVGTTPAPIDRFGRKRKDFVKVSLGAEEFVKWEHVSDTLPVLEKLKEEKYKIIALEQHKDSKSLEARTKKLKHFALIVGNEVEGVSKNVLKMCDEILEIPMRGQKESMNVSVSTGIALFNLL
jgi:23S rRNA (guanosine2251-2'-O)-methyltransferase